MTLSPHKTLPITFSSLARFNDPPTNRESWQKLLKITGHLSLFFCTFFFFMFGRLSQKMTDNRLKKKHKVNEIFWISRRISGWECSRTNNAGFCWSQNLTSHLLIVYNGLVYFFISVKKNNFWKGAINMNNCKCRCLHFRTTIWFILYFWIWFNMIYFYFWIWFIFISVEN